MRWSRSHCHGATVGDICIGVGRALDHFLSTRPQMLRHVCGSLEGHSGVVRKGFPVQSLVVGLPVVAVRIAVLLQQTLHSQKEQLRALCW